MDEKYRSDNARKTNSKKFPNSYLYILNIVDTSYYKIGVSQSPKRRIRDISVCMPFDVKTIYLKEHPLTYNLEEFLHDAFRDKELKHEWFDLTKYDLVKISNTLNDFSEEGVYLEKRIYQESLIFV